VLSGSEWEKRDELFSPRRIRRQRTIAGAGELCDRQRKHTEKELAHRVLPLRGLFVGPGGR